MTFDILVKKVLKHEGGYVNDPSDPGGETKYGISKRAFPNLDIKNLTEEQAILIYYDEYWLDAKVDKLPDELHEIYFDMVVNMGKSRAIKILQEACNHKAKKELLKVDGRIGSKTISGSKKVEQTRVQSFRVKYYANLVERKPTLIKYWYGWYKRALTT